MNLKIVILVTIVFVVGLLITLLILNKLYKKTNHYKNTVYQLEKYLKEVPEDLELINTGSSYARYAFDYSYSSLKGFNFGLQPQSLSYDFRILKQYTLNLKKDCIVLITLPNLVFGFLDYENEHSNTKYYYFLEPKNILGYSKLKYLTRVMFPFLSSKRNAFRIIRDVTLKEPYKQVRNLMNESQIRNDASLRVEGWKKQFKLKNTFDNNFSDELEKMFESTTSLLNEMIEYCRDNGFRPVIVVPPCSGIINELLSKRFIKKALYDNIERANKKNIPVFDYLYDERFQNYKLYINSDMLNETGREKFTRVVEKDLEKLGLIS